VAGVAVCNVTIFDLYHVLFSNIFHSCARFICVAV